MNGQPTQNSDWAGFLPKRGSNINGRHFVNAVTQDGTAWLQNIKKIKMIF